jgi:hypothetical protein
MAQLSGKQIKDLSLELSKINTATGQILDLSGGTSSIYVSDNSITGNTSIVNKKYVDNEVGDLQTELDATQLGAGLEADGSYLANSGANYIDAAESLMDADMLLDAALKVEEIARIAGDIATLASATASDATTLAAANSYTDGVAQGLDVKESVVIITYEPITLSGTQSIQGIDLGVNDRVLVAAQGGTVSGYFTLNTENGIYTVQEGSWVRSNDADNDPNEEVTKGMFTFVEEGTYADQGFVLSVITDPIAGPNDRLMADLGVSQLKFSQFSGAGQITAGSGLTKTGNTLDVNVDNITIEIVSDTLQVKDSGITSDKIADDSVTKSKLNSDVAGTGLVQAVDGSLEVNDLYIQGLITVTDSTSIDFTKTDGEITASVIIGQLYNDSTSFYIAADGVTLDRAILANNLRGATASTSIGSNDGVLSVQIDGVTVIRDVDGKLEVGTITTANISGFTASVRDSITVGDTDTISMTFSGGQIEAEVKDASLTPSKLSATGEANGNILSYVDGDFVWVNPADTGDITDVVAGLGLVGGGTSGSVTLNVQATNGLNVDETSDSVELGGTMSKNTTIIGAANDLTFDGVGAFMVKDVESFDVTSDFVMIDAGTGITQILGDGDITINSYSGQVFLGATGNSIAISATTDGDIITTSHDGKGIQYADNYTASFVTNSLVTKQYVDGLVSANSGATMVNANKDMVALLTTVDNQLATNTAIANTPAGYVQVFVNGVKVSLGDGVKTKDCYFSADGGTTAKAISAIVINDLLYWNGSVTGYQLDTSDSIDFDYEVSGI